MLQFPSTRPATLNRIMLLLCHNFPRVSPSPNSSHFALYRIPLQVRKSTADQFYVTLLTFDELLAVDVSDVVMELLSDTAWYNMHVHVHCMACACRLFRYTCMYAHVSRDGCTCMYMCPGICMYMCPGMGVHVHVSRDGGVAGVREKRNELCQVLQLPVPKLVVSQPWPHLHKHMHVHVTSRPRLQQSESPNLKMNLLATKVCACVCVVCMCECFP